MNGYSIFFAAFVILTLAIILGTVAFLTMGGIRHMPPAPWQRRRTHHYRP